MKNEKFHVACVDNETGEPLTTGGLKVDLDTDLFVILAKAGTDPEFGTGILAAMSGSTSEKDVPEEDVRAMVRAFFDVLARFANQQEDDKAKAGIAAMAIMNTLRLMAGILGSTKIAGETVAALAMAFAAGAPDA